MRWVSGCLLRLATVVIVCLALFAGVLWLAGGRTQPPGPTIATPSPAPLSTPAAPGHTVTPDAGAAAGARRKLAAVVQTATAAPAGSHEPVQVTLSEAEVNAVAVPELENDADFPLQQPSVQLLPGRVVLHGQAALGPTLLPVAVTGSVSITAGVPMLTVISVQAGGFDAPQSLVNQVSDQLASSLRLTPSDLPITVQRVTVGDHTMTMAGVTK